MNSISQVVSALGIQMKDPSSKEILIICPSHADRSFGSAMINSVTGQWSCKSCGAHGNIITLASTVWRIDTKEAYRRLCNDNLIEGYIRSQSLLEWKESKKKEREEEKKLSILSPLSGHQVIKFTCEENEYASKRFWDQEFIDACGAKLCVNGRYEGYLLIPIIDQEANINTFEARKVFESERIREYLDIQDNIPLKKLRKLFSEWANNSGAKMTKDENNRTVFMVRGKVTDNSILRYLLLPRVLYPSQSMVKKPTIWNYDFLKKDKGLWISEGWASIPRLWKVSKGNASCTFGATISDLQIKLLSNFPFIVLVKDDGAGGDAMYKTLRDKLETELFLADTELNDEDPEYENECANIVTPIEWSMKRNRLGDFGIK